MKNTMTGMMTTTVLKSHEVLSCLLKSEIACYSPMCMCVVVLVQKERVFVNEKRQMYANSCVVVCVVVVVE